MTYRIEWTRRATKDAAHLDAADRRRVVTAVGTLADWPACRGTVDVKALKGHTHQYRLRVGRYRVLFDVEDSLEVVSVERVRKRDERTY
ncbi:type II toxin-antitoxin system RelE family toxin [Arhodomonas sp. SL1]|uniref:type II toxin-antitoxin system RelE family toxin n=1 Tax=Arhodomonas sp. SL1 TaxID=3425691 RepID=UPI003F8827BD